MSFAQVSMDFPELKEIIEHMILEHDYPGFEVRSLKLGLPEAALKSSAKVFAQALEDKSVYVKLAALRWFYDRPGLARSHFTYLLILLDHSDEWVRLEAIRTLEQANVSKEEVLLKISSLLQDTNEMVRQEAAKALGKLITNKKDKYAEIIALLRETATADANEKVRFKAQKALRRLGAYSISASG